MRNLWNLVEEGRNDGRLVFWPLRGAPHQETWWQEPAADRGNDAILVWDKVEVVLGCPGEL